MIRRRASGGAGWTGRAVAHLVLLLFTLRAAIPIGYMPDLGALRDGRIEIVICTPAGVKTVAVDAEGRPADDDRAKSAASECPFHAAIAKAMAAPALLDLSTAAAPRPDLPPAASSSFPTRPAQGPPLGPRAPPSVLA